LRTHILNRYPSERNKDIIGGLSWAQARPIDPWFLYTYDHMHGSYYYRVSEREVLANFPKNVDEVGIENKFVPDWTESGFRAWQKADAQRADAQSLLIHLKAAQMGWWIEKHPDSVPLMIEQEFCCGIAWQRMGLFPLVQLAEWTYLSAVIVLAAYPWLRGGGRWAWAIHTAVIPPLLLLPYYLGYCAWAFSSAGPGGGIVYPRILYFFRGFPWTSFDQAVIQYIPHILAPLTGPLGNILAMSGGRAAGPVSVMCLGLALGSFVFCLGTLSHRFRRPPRESLRKHRGVESL
jgi:hypothetical protein